MRLHYLPCTCLAWAGATECHALVSKPSFHIVPRNLRLSVGFRPHLDPPGRSASRLHAWSDVKRDCMRIRGGWGSGWNPKRRSVVHERVSCSRETTEADKESPDVRGGAVPRKVPQTTNWLDAFSGPIQLQVRRFLPYALFLRDVCCREMFQRMRGVTVSYSIRYASPLRCAR